MLLSKELIADEGTYAHTNCSARTGCFSCVPFYKKRLEELHFTLVQRHTYFMLAVAGFDDLPHQLIHILVKRFGLIEA